MTKYFEFESDYFGTQREYCARMRIEVMIVAHCEDDACGEIVYIEDLEAECERKLEDFPPEEQKRIEQYVDELACEHGHEAWFEAQQAREEALYDAWKEGN